jgi:hypothetical protein
MDTKTGISSRILGLKNHGQFTFVDWVDDTPFLYKTRIGNADDDGNVLFKVGTVTN